jgi:hypothetical protein
MVASNQFVTTDFEPFFFDFIREDVHPQSKTRRQNVHRQNVHRPYSTSSYKLYLLLHEQLDEF